jgi:hypothetical protein
MKAWKNHPNIYGGNLVKHHDDKFGHQHIRRFGPGVGGWPSRPSRKAGFQPAATPPAPPAFPPPRFNSPTDPTTGEPGRRCRISKLPPAAEEATAGRRTKAGERVGDLCVAGDL